MQDSVERNGWAVRSLKNKFFKSFTERQIGNDEDFHLLAATHVVSISSKLIPRGDKNFSDGVEIALFEIAN